MDYAQAKDRGDFGEAQVRAAVDEVLGEGRWALHDVLLDLGKATSQIDHLVIDRFGILMIETKCYAALFKGTSDDRQWTACYKNGQHKKVLNPLQQNELHRKRLHQALAAAGRPLDSTFIQSLVVFADGAIQHLSLNDVDRQRVVDLSDVAAFIRDREDFQPSKGMPIEEAEQLLGALLALDRSADEEAQAKHGKNVGRHATREEGSRKRERKSKSAGAAGRRRYGAPAKPKRSPFENLLRDIAVRLLAAVFALALLFAITPMLQFALTRSVARMAGSVSEQPVQPKAIASYDIPIAKQRLAEADPTIAASLVDGDHPVLGTERGLPSYTWKYRHVASGQERSITIVLGINGQIVAVTGQ